MADFNPADASAAPSEAQGGEPEDESRETDSDYQSALVPKSLFSESDDLTVGQEEKVRILHIYEDEVEIACVKSGKPNKTQMEDSMEGMDRYSKMREG